MFTIFMVFVAIYMIAFLAIIATVAIKRQIRRNRAYRKIALRSLLRAAKARAIAKYGAF